MRSKEQRREVEKVQGEGNRVRVDDGADDVGALQKLNVYCITGHSIKKGTHIHTQPSPAKDSKPFRSPYCCTSGSPFLIASSRLASPRLFSYLFARFV